MNPAELKVLLVDDDLAMLRVLSLWLEKAGYPVRTATDGRQALAAIEADCPHVLVTDWEMPNMNGLELCRSVRDLSLPHYVYLLFLTVKSTPHEIIAGLEMGADDFLTKPVERGQFLARIRACSRVLQLERRLSLMASTDPLTKLLTQRAFYEVLEKEWARAQRSHLPLSCVMMDLDFFKRINDTHGHPAGDAVLKTVANVLVENSRVSDSVCRYGGEEFCIMLPGTTDQEAWQWAERIRQTVAAQAICCGQNRLRITASFGTAQRHDDTHTPEQLVDLADQALLCAKQSGRDRVVRFESLGEASELAIQQDYNHGELFRGIVARHVMTPLATCLREDETIGQATEFFLRSRINSSPVVDAGNRLLGILSEKDLMAAMVSLDCWQQPVGEVMKPNVICYEEDVPIRTIYEFLCRVSIRRVVIVRQERPVGTISRATLLRWFRNLVFAKGLMEHPEGTLPRCCDAQHAQQQMAETARQLARQASQLELRFQENAADLVPYVVGSATGLQALVTDLLAYSHYVDSSGEPTAAEVLVASVCDPG